MPNITKKQVALITGCSSGFGLLSAVELAKAGFQVFASMRNLAKRGALDSSAKGLDIEIIELDVNDEAAISKALEHIRASAGQIDVLVNNAGICIAGFIEESSMDEIRQVFETDFFGAVALMKAVLPEMRERRSGRIINVSSVSGYVPSPLLAAYSAAKAAMIAFSTALNLETMGEGYFISTIVPGSFKTEIFQSNATLAKKLLDKDSPHHKKTAYLQKKFEKIIAGLTQDPKDVAKAIVSAATAKHPKTEYLVGKDAKIQSILKWILPQRLFEKAIKSFWFNDFDTTSN